MTPTVWTHLEDARQAIEAAGLVLPNPSALDDQLDRAYAGVVLRVEHTLVRDAR